MADTVLWSNLPADILSIIAKILNTDVDVIHLRSVCSAWRSSVRRLYRPSIFPLDVPPLFSNRSFLSRTDGHYLLDYATLYRISPPECGPYAGDPSDAWLVRVLEVNPNSFKMLLPAVPVKNKWHQIPKCVNLLYHRISEIYKFYGIRCVRVCPEERELLMTYARKLTVLWNYAVDCDFVVLCLCEGGDMCYWKFGDEDWTTINTMDYHFNDFVLCDGKFYAISREGVLGFLDSNLNLIVTPLSPLPVNCNEHDFNLVAYKSDLYVVAKFYDKSKGNPDSIHSVDYDSIDEDDDATDKDEESIIEIPLELKIFKKGTYWEHIKCLGDEVFILCQEFSVGLSTKDFRGCKGNSVYLTPRHLHPYEYHSREIMKYGVYDLDELRTLVMKMVQSPSLICSPPPNWLLCSSSSSNS